MIRPFFEKVARILKGYHDKYSESVLSSYANKQLSLSSGFATPSTQDFPTAASPLTLENPVPLELSSTQVNYGVPENDSILNHLQPSYPISQRFPLLLKSTENSFPANGKAPNFQALEYSSIPQLYPVESISWNSSSTTGENSGTPGDGAAPPKPFPRESGASTFQILGETSDIKRKNSQPPLTHASPQGQVNYQSINNGAANNPSSLMSDKPSSSSNSQQLQPRRRCGKCNIL